MIKERAQKVKPEEPVMKIPEIRIINARSPILQGWKKASLDQVLLAVAQDPSFVTEADKIEGATGTSTIRERRKGFFKLEDNGKLTKIRSRSRLRGVEPGRTAYITPGKHAAVFYARYNYRIDISGRHSSSKNIAIVRIDQEMVKEAILPVFQERNMTESPNMQLA